MEKGKHAVVLSLSHGIELVIKEKYLRRYKRYRTSGTRPKYLGVYNDEDHEEEYEIWIERSLSEGEKIITLIHEILHFVGEVSEELSDPADFDRIAEFIYDMSLKRHKRR